MSTTGVLFMHFSIFYLTQRLLVSLRCLSTMKCNIAQWNWAMLHFIVCHGVKTKKVNLTAEIVPYLYNFAQAWTWDVTKQCLWTIVKERGIPLNLFMSLFLQLSRRSTPGVKRTYPKSTGYHFAFYADMHFSPNSRVISTYAKFSIR